MGLTENGDRELAVSPEVESAPATEPPASPREPDRRGRRFRGSGASAAERNRLLAEVRNVEFPSGLRGYDRAAVDRYVEQVNRLIAELEISASPESAVRHALDEVSEETRDLLQRAHQTAEEITARSQIKAEDRLEQAEAEADQVRDEARQEASELRSTAQRDATELRAEAQRDATELRAEAQRDATEARAAAQHEAEEIRTDVRRETEEMVGNATVRARELSRNAETIWRERRRLIEDMRVVGEQLVAVGETEGKRFPHFIGEELLGPEPAEERAALPAPPPGAPA